MVTSLTLLKPALLLEYYSDGCSVLETPLHIGAFSCAHRESGGAALR